MFILYIFSIIITFLVFYFDYRKGKREFHYKFSIWEMIIGFIIIPTIPGLNILLAAIIFLDH